MHKAYKQQPYHSDKQLNNHLVYRKKHHSTTLLHKSPNQPIAVQIIHQLLEHLFAQQQQQDMIVEYQLQQLKELEQFDFTYSRPETQHTPQLMPTIDEEPLPQSRSNTEGSRVLPKKQTKKSQNEREPSLMEVIEESQSRFVQRDRKVKEQLIQKLRRQYSSILHCKYISQSRAIVNVRESGQEDERITILRRVYEKQGKLKLKLKDNQSHRLNSNSNRSDSYHQQVLEISARRQNHNNNFSRGKASRANKMDEFAQLNSSNIDQYLKSRQASLIDGLHIPTEDTVTAKESKLQDIKNLIATEKVKIKYSYAGAGPLPVGRASTIHHASDRENHHRDQLKKAVQSVYISMGGGRLKDSQKEGVRANQSFIGLLPKINRK